ncbi:MAG: hypothetical protein QXL88_00245 [Candidatus Pacearchaeota archaeon]
MVLPEINFKISYYLHSEILSSSYNFNRLFRFVNSFEKFFKKRKKEVLKSIEKLTGFGWKQKNIDVWFFDSWHPSVSYPLLLNVYGFDKDFVFFNLVHELVHNNLFDLVIYKSKKDKKKYDMIELEAFVNLITKYVLLKFFNEKKVNELCKKAEFGGVYKYVWKRAKELENKINFEKTNLKKWIQRYGERWKYTIKTNFP